jgi:hypothetical protein
MSTTTLQADSVGYRSARLAGRSALGTARAHVGRTWSALRVALNAAAAYDAARTAASRRAALSQFQAELGR